MWTYYKCLCSFTLLGCGTHHGHILWCAVGDLKKGCITGTVYWEVICKTQGATQNRPERCYNAGRNDELNHCRWSHNQFSWGKKETPRLSLGMWWLKQGLRSCKERGFRKSIGCDWPVHVQRETIWGWGMHPREGAAKQSSDHTGQEEFTYTHLNKALWRHSQSWGTKDLGSFLKSKPQKDWNVSDLNASSNKEKTFRGIQNIRTP